jgi:hypothetical protein
MRISRCMIVVSFVACGGASFEPTNNTRHDGGADAAPSDAAMGDEPKGHDASASEAGAIDGSSDAPTTGYHDMTASAFSTFDTTTVNASAKGFFGAAFDGRYLYLVPQAYGLQHGIVARYDTTTTFATATSWSTFDITSVDSNAQYFRGAAFDGRYVYFVPLGGNSVDGGHVARYDTTATFTTTTSWTTFDVTTVNATAKGFTGATFDGRYVYLVPQSSDAMYDGVVARYDTTSAFGSASSWSTFDTASANKNAKGFCGATFDGRYVYLVPYENDAGYDGVVTQYDTTASFTASGSWSTFDTTKVDANAKAFFGAAFDGRYVYLVPRGTTVSAGVVARYDTTAKFTASASWSTFDTTLVDADAAGFIGAAFDGRYVYLVPFTIGINPSFLTRYDTSASFTTASSWSSFDTSTVNAAATNFIGAAFDGRYVYLVPNEFGTSGVVARFDARTPPSMPSLPAWSGSFL